MSTIEKKANQINLWKLLQIATGYSAVYCKKVVKGDRSQTSKGGKIIMKKYNELEDLLKA